MTVSAHQPAYLPWLGYLDKVKKSDVFVFLDTVQYEKNSFTNRNKIRTKDGWIWLSIPVIKTGHMNSTMMDMQIDTRSKWNQKHLRSIELNYKKARNFGFLYPQLEVLYSKSYDRLVDATWDHLMFWLELYDIHTKIIRSSTLNLNGKKNDLILDLCRTIGADVYISGALGKDYIDLDTFTANDIQVGFQDYQHPVYPQLYDGFLPNMGIIDHAMNTQTFAI